VSHRVEAAPSERCQWEQLDELVNFWVPLMALGFFEEISQNQKFSASNLGDCGQSGPQPAFALMVCAQK